MIHFFISLFIFANVKLLNAIVINTVISCFIIAGVCLLDSPDGILGGAVPQDGQSQRLVSNVDKTISPPSPHD